MAACEMLGAAVAALLNVCTVAAPLVDAAPNHSDIPDRPLHLRADSAPPVSSITPPARQASEPVRTAPLPASVVMGIGMLGGLILTAALKRRKT